VEFLDALLPALHDVVAQALPVEDPLLMSQPSLSILSLAMKLRRGLHTRQFTMHHALRLARSMGYPRQQARYIVDNVYSQPVGIWRSLYS
jgi:hypothetical protein